MNVPATYDADRAFIPQWRKAMSFALFPLALASMVIFGLAYFLAWITYGLCRWADGRKDLGTFWEWLNIIR